MWEFLKNLKNFLSLDYRSLFIVLCIGWIVFLVPFNIWEGIGVAKQYTQFRPWIFIVSLIATVWFLMGGLYDLLKLGKEKLASRKETQKIIGEREKTLLAASKVEKAVLARYLADDTTTIAFDFRDGIVNGLIAKNILYRASQGSNPFSHDFDVNIQSWAWEYLKNHPELLKSITPIEDGRHRIRL